MESRRRIIALMTPPSLWMLVLFVLPLAAMCLFSFRAGTSGAARGIWTLANYANFLGNLPYQRLLLSSTVTAMLTAIGAIVLAYPLAYYLAFRAGPRRMLLLTLIILPAWTSYLLRILSWRVMLGSNGLFNSLLLSLGLVREALPILLYSSTAVIITLIYVWIPFAMLPIFATLERIDRSQIEAAADLGCKPWEVLLRVIVPLSLPGVASAFMFVFIPTLGEYVTPLLVGGARGIMYGNIIQDQFVRALNWPVGSLLSVVMLIVALLVLMLFSRVVRSPEMTRV
jgi:spermidine/putrescine transport system permease protein